MSKTSPPPTLRLWTGYFSLPQGSGWGVEVDVDFLRKNQAEAVDGVIPDPGLNMFKSTNWNKRALR